MLRLYCAVIIAGLILIPHTVNGFFLGDPTNITVTRNISCRQTDNTTSVNDFQFCAIRIYSGADSTQSTNFTLYNGLLFLNTLSQFIQKRCSQFVHILNEEKETGIGSGYCDGPRSFETFSQLQLCICATDNCNKDYESCMNSIGLNHNITQISDFMPDLNSIVQCDNSINASNICQEHPFINVSLCEEYVSSNSVLCAITVYGTGTTQISMIYENYKMALSEQIYEVMSVSNGTARSSFNETQTNVYYKYLDNNSQSVEGCACTSYPLCNQNMKACLSQTTLQAETTMLTPSSMHNSFPTLISDYTSSTSNPTSAIIAATTITSINPITTVTSLTDSVITTMSATSTTATTYTNSIMITMSVTSATAVTFTDSTTTVPFTDSTTTVPFTDSTTTVPFTDSTTTVPFTDSTTTVPFTDSTTTVPFTDSTTTAQPSIVIPNPVAQNFKTGEPGLGRSATAGIACGIIFSAVIFTAEIVFFKFFYSGSMGHAVDRSVAYRA